MHPRFHFSFPPALLAILPLPSQTQRLQKLGSQETLRSPVLHRLPTQMQRSARHNRKRARLRYETVLVHGLPVLLPSTFCQKVGKIDSNRFSYIFQINKFLGTESARMFSGRETFDTGFFITSEYDTKTIDNVVDVSNV